MEENLKLQREKLLNKIFQLMLKIAFIFAIPAFGSFLLGSFLDNKYNSKPNITITLLAISFLLSWIIVVYLYRKISIELRELKEKEELQVKNKQKELQEKIKIK